jgi:hypothetical protein
LVKLDLPEAAEDLLRHQIKYRLQGEERLRTADDLAIILLMDQKPREAMMVLDDTDRDNFSFEEHLKRVRLRAQALVDLQRYDEAVGYLKQDDSRDAAIIVREALFQGKKWSDYIEVTRTELPRLLANITKDNSAEQDVLRLAIAYYLLNDRENLSSLSNAVGNATPKLQSAIELLLTGSSKIDYRHLDQSLKIDQIQQLLNKYKSNFIER